MSEYNHKIGTIKSPEDLYSLENFETTIDFSDDSKVKLNEIIDKYTFPKEQAIKCGIKGCRQPHQSGYLARTDNNKLTNIGNVCGKNIIGVSFKEAKRIFSDKERAVKNKDSLILIQNNIITYNERIDDLIKLSGVLFKCKQAFKSLLPNMFQEILLRSKTGSTAIYKNVLLSERDLEVYETSRFNKPRMEKIGDIFYCDFFLKDICELVRENIKKPIDELKKNFDNLESLRDRDLSKLSKSVNDAISILPIAEEQANKGLKFYQETNLKKLTLLRANAKDVFILIAKCKELLNN